MDREFEQALWVDCPTCGRLVSSIGGAPPFCPFCFEEREQEKAARAGERLRARQEQESQDTGVYWHKAPSGFWFPCRNGQWIPDYQWRVSSTDANTYVLYKGATIKGCYGFTTDTYYHWEAVTRSWQQRMKPWAPYEGNDF